MAEARFSKPVRMGLWALLSVGLLLGAIGVGARLIAATDLGREFAQSRLEQAEIRGQSFEIDGLEGDVLGRLTFDTLTVSDADGVWLQVEGGALSWSPIPLLQERAHVRRIEAQRVVMLRWPTIAPAPSSGGGSFVRTYQIDVARFPDIETTANVTRAEAHFAADGQLLIGGGAGDVDFELVPEEAAGDRIDAALAWRPNAPLIGRAEGEGPAGGLLAQLLGLSDEDAPSFILSATRANDAADVAFELNISGETKAEATASLAREDAVAEGRIDLSAFPTLQSLADRIGDEAQVSLAASRDRVFGRMETRLINADVSAPFDLDRLQLRDGLTDFSVRTAEMSEVLGVEELVADELTLEGRATREDGRWILVGDVRATGLRAPGGSFDQIGGPATASYAPDTGSLRGGARLRAMAAVFDDSFVGRIAGEAPDVALDFDFSPSANTLSLSDLEVGLAIGEFEADGALALDAREADFKGAFDFSELGLALGWPIDATQGTWTFVGDADSYAVDVNGRVDPLAGSESSLETWLEGGVDYDAAIASDNGQIRISSLDLEGRGVRLTARGDVSNGATSLLADGIILGGDLGGASFADVAVSGALLGERYSFEFQTPELSVAGETLSDARLSIDGRSARDDLSLNLKAGGDWRGSPASFVASLGLAEDNWRASDLVFDWSGFTAVGDLSGEFEDWTRLSGAVDFEIAERSRLARGGGAGAVSLSRGAVDGRFSVVDVELQYARIGTADLVLAGTPDKAALDLDLSGGLQIGGVMQPLQLDLDVEANPFEQSADIEFVADISDQIIASNGPIGFQRDAGGLSLVGAASVFEGLASLDYRSGPVGRRLALDWEDVDIGGVASLYGRPGLAGRANGDIRLDIDADDVDGFVNARIIELGRAGDSAHANAMLQTRFEDRRASGELVVSGTNELDLNVFADLPIDVDASSLAVGVRPNAGMTFNASGGGPLGPVWAAAGPVNTRFEGRFGVDANYEGRTQAFRPDGSVSLKSGLFEDGDSGLFLKDVSLDARLRQDAIELLALDARGADGGRIEGAGRYAFDGAADIDLKLHRLDALRRSDIRAVLSGGLSFGAQAQGAALTGALKINEAHINVENLPRTKFKTLNVRFDEAPIEEAPAVSQDQSVALDIAMKADRRIYIQGGGFETEWDADMHVGGFLSAPLLDGEARILRGDLDFVGRRFEFVDSEVVFAGSPDKTQLALKAVYETDALTAAVEVTGVPDDPAIALTSDPDLPQDEVLSHILFGESAAGFGGVQSAQLAAGLAAISGGEAGFDLTGSLRDALGVDRLDLGTSSDGTASLRAGQYVAPDVYVELMSNARGAPGWGVTWTPQRRIEVGAEREAEDAPKFSVKWRRDYDFDNPLDGVRATGE